MLLLFVGGVIVLLGVIVGFLTISRKSTNPQKSYLNAFLSVMLTPLRVLKLGPYKQGSITLDKAIKYAMKKTKLTDFADKEFTKTYDIILLSKAQKSFQYSNLGYISARIEMNMTMVRKLKAVEYFKNCPHVLNTQVRQPIFVLGLPRTGTTFLHRLLSLDPQHRAPACWELLASIPSVATPYSSQTANLYAKDRADRQKKITELIATNKKIGDGSLAHIHEIGADLPEECVLALSDDLPLLLQLLPAIYLNFLETSQFLDHDMFVKAYTGYKKILQVLSYQIGDSEHPKRWCLKCPVHVYFTRAIAKVFPDAKLVWTHRHPVSAVPSLCSLLKSFHQVYYETSSRDDLQLGKAVSIASADGLSKAIDDIPTTKLDCANVIYNELIKDPIGTVEKVYATYGWEITPEFRKNMDEYLIENKKERELLKLKKSKEVLHSYSPKEFGLTEEELSSGDFKKYIDTYKIPYSNN
eukprot:gene15666-21190_t